MEGLRPPKLLSVRNFVFLILFVFPQIILLAISIYLRLHIYVIIHTISFFVLLAMIIDQRIPMFMSSLIINVSEAYKCIFVKMFLLIFSIFEFQCPQLHAKINLDILFSIVYQDEEVRK